MLVNIKNLLHSKKWRLTLKVLRIVVFISVAKLVVHYAKLEFLPLSSLFTAIISANIFLIGFLITGVLSDYKESEKLPNDLAVSLMALVDEMSIILQNKRSKIAKDGINHVRDLTSSLVLWFHKREKTISIINKINELNHYFLSFSH